MQTINILWRKTMSKKARPGRDAFTFSLRGMTTIAPFSIKPAIADDRINQIRDGRLSRPHEDQPTDDRPSTVRVIEDVLARYFAPGCCRAA